VTGYSPDRNMLQPHQQVLKFRSGRASQFTIIAVRYLGPFDSG
jgi:hypothetical protein